MTEEELKTDEPKHIIELVIKDKLKKEAEEWLRSTDNHLNEEKTHFLSESEYAERAYLAGAEPREKRIAELEAQIEKMKADVKQGQSYWNSGEMQYDLYQRLLDKWEIKEK